LFLRPYILLAVILVWGGWALLHRKGKPSPYAILRLIALTALIFGIAGLTARSGRSSQVVLLTDVSASLGPPAERLAYGEKIERVLTRHNSVTQYTFAGQTLPVTGRDTDGVSKETDTNHTDVAGAIAMALAAKPGTGAVIIISDFRDNPVSASVTGGIPNQQRQSGTVVSMVKGDSTHAYLLLPVSPGPDVRVEKLVAPSSYKSLSGIPVTAYVAAAEPVTAHYEFSTAAGKKTGSVTVPAGVLLPISEVVNPADGPSTYVTFTITTEGDVIPANNTAMTVSLRATPPKVVVLTDGNTQSLDPKSFQTDAVLLTADALTQRLLSGRDIPDVVVLSDFEMQAHQMLTAALVPAVRELGVGVLYLGGEHSFGAGGLTDTDAATSVLPALMRPPGGAGLDVTVMLDRSGSMGRSVNGTAKLDIVRKAVTAGLSTLKPSDTMTLIVFNNAAETLLDSKPFDSEAVNTTIWGISAGGGTDVAAPLRAASDKKSGERRKLTFLLTDGDPDRGEEGKQDAVDAAKALAGADLNIIGTGSAQDESFLREMAKAGGASLVLKADDAMIRRAIQRAVDEARNPFTSDSPATLRYMTAHSVVAGIEPLTLSIHNRLSVKPGAMTLAVVGREDAPEAAIAVMQAGLGRTAIVAATPSDMTPAGDVTKLLERLTEWLARADASHMSTFADPSRNTIIAETSNDDILAFPLPRRGGRGKSASLTMTLTPVSGGEPIKLNSFKSGPGTCEAAYGELSAGLYTAQLGDDPDTLSAPLTIPPARELLFTGIDQPQLQALTAAGAHIVSETELDKPLGNSKGRPSTLPDWIAFVFAIAGWVWEMFAPRRRSE
jgi:hypothetical protein